MNLSKRYIWVVLVAFVLIVASVLLHRPQSAVSNDKENQQPKAENLEVLQVFAGAHITAVTNVGDSAFTAYVAGPLQEICPFYFPDGIAYRNCLGDLVERGKAAYGGKKSDITDFENYCNSISKQYEAGVESLNLYSSCMAYKLNAL